METLISYVVSPYGQTAIPEPVRHSALMRAVRKYRDDAMKIQAYREKLVYRWAQGTAYFLWKHHV
jgi:hypothetical protein